MGGGSEGEERRKESKGGRKGGTSEREKRKRITCAVHTPRALDTEMMYIPNVTEREK